MINPCSKKASDCALRGDGALRNAWDGAALAVFFFRATEGGHPVCPPKRQSHPASLAKLDGSPSLRNRVAINGLYQQASPPLAVSQ